MAIQFHVFWILCLQLPLVVLSQNLPLPIDIQNLYESSSTRSLTGYPGDHYWINKTKYDIDVWFNPKSNHIKAKAHIVYFNESPDTIDYLVFRLYQNHFKIGNTRNRRLPAEEIHEGMKIEVTGIDQIKNNYEPIFRGSLMEVELPEPLYGKDSVTVNLQWAFDLPVEVNSRFGIYDKAAFIGLWYPQIAVYDDVEGWDQNQFEWYQEFYNDFNDFNVKIHVPENYIVRATGQLQNPKEVLSYKVYQRYKKALNSDSIVHIVDEKQLGKQITAKGKVIWNYKANNVPDFAFGVSNEYIWDAKWVPLNRTESVFLSAFYDAKNIQFRKALKYAEKAIIYFSYDTPGHLFPYPEMTIFNGAIGGMEYPMIVNNAAPSRNFMSVLLTSHELAHMYFPFLMGINETKYAWMDEGWATMLPLKIQQKQDTTADFISEMVNSYERHAGTSHEIPPMYPTQFINQNGYSAYKHLSYYRAGMAYYILQDVLGEKKFNRAMQKYIRVWSGKHPLPYDFFHLFNNASGEHLNWFWKPWFYESGYPDLGILKVDQFNGKLVVRIKKAGKLPIPIHLKVYSEDELVIEDHVNASVWSQTSVHELRYSMKRPVTKVVLGSAYIPDVKMDNNQYEID